MSFSRRHSSVRGAKSSLVPASSSASRTISPAGQSASGAECSGTRTVLDPDGDLILRAKSPAWVQNGTECEFLVDSHAMRRASPVWKCMLFGPWAESRPADGSQWVVSLPEDDPAALKPVLQIAHGEPGRMVERNPDVILRTIILCDKYDTFELIGPWIHDWKAILAQQFGSGHWQYAAFSAWCFGDTPWFAEACHHMLVAEASVRHGKVDGTRDEVHYSEDYDTEDGFGEKIKPVEATGKTVVDVLPAELCALPETVISRISEVRESLKQSILNMFRQYIDKLRSDDGDSDPLVRYAAAYKRSARNNNHGFCSLVVLGGITGALLSDPMNLGCILLDMLYASDIPHISVSDLIKRIQNVFKDVETLDGHDECSPVPIFAGYLEEIEYSKWMYMLSQNEEYHLARQRRKIYKTRAAEIGDQMMREYHGSVSLWKRK